MCRFFFYVLKFSCFIAQPCIYWIVTKMQRVYNIFMFCSV